MIPLSLQAANKLLSRLTTGVYAGDDLASTIAAMGAALGTAVPAISAAQIVISSAPSDIADKNMQLTYPRICIYSSGISNTQIEKFRSFSGQVSLVAEIWSSAEFVTQSDTWIHIYTEAVAELLQQSTGDWGDGMFFSGVYDVQFTAPQVGGLGFVQSARLGLAVGVSLA